MRFILSQQFVYNLIILESFLLINLSLVNKSLISLHKILNWLAQSSFGASTFMYFFTGIKKFEFWNNKQ